ncbi:MAG: SDR family oxidoreductase [Myxococcota bacterium]
MDATPLLPGHLSLSGRRALICGASSGIGRASAFAFAALGAELVITARRTERLADMVAPLRDQGAADVHVVASDFDDHTTLRGLAERPCHIVLHNTGGPKGGPLLKADPSELQAAFHRHVMTAHQLLQAHLPFMTDAGYGRFLTVLSTSVREPIPNLGVSNLTRAAMASWAKTVSRELPPGLTINNLLPGFTDTERLDQLKTARAKREGVGGDAVHRAWLNQIPEGRLARAEEPAALLAFLASPAGSYIRGQSIAVDGGRLRSI